MLQVCTAKNEASESSNAENEDFYVRRGFNYGKRKVFPLEDTDFYEVVKKCNSWLNSESDQ